MGLQEKYAHRHREVVEALRWLECGHLPEDLREVTVVITRAVDELMGMLGDGPQLMLGLHGLTAAKDCLVRQKIIDRESSHTS